MVPDRTMPLESTTSGSPAEIMSLLLVTPDETVVVIGQPSRGNGGAGTSPDSGVVSKKCR
jgi:hypothetical protein